MRELSAQLTEGEILDRHIDMLAHTAKFPVNIQITNSHYRQIHRFQFFCALFIFFRVFGENRIEFFPREGEAAHLIVILSGKNILDCVIT